MLLLRRCILCLVLLFSIAVCTELVFDEEFVVIDGIRVRADSIKSETNNFDDKNKKEKESGEQGRDDIIEEQTDDDGSDDDENDEEESDNEEDDDLEATKHLPTKCHGKIELRFHVKCSVKRDFCCPISWYCSSKSSHISLHSF